MSSSLPLPRQSSFAESSMNPLNISPIFNENPFLPIQTPNFFRDANTTITTTEPSFGFSQLQDNTSLFCPTQQINSPSSFNQTGYSSLGLTGNSGGTCSFSESTLQPTTSLFGKADASTNNGFENFKQSFPVTNLNTNDSGISNDSFEHQMVIGDNIDAGTIIAKFQPVVVKKLQCITAMKEYDLKSLEELRIEDYLAYQKDLQVDTSGCFSDITPSIVQSCQEYMETTTNKSLFDNVFCQSSASAFGAATNQNSFLVKPFVAPATTGFKFANSDSLSNAFDAKSDFKESIARNLCNQQLLNTSTANEALFDLGQSPTELSNFYATQLALLFENTTSVACPKSAPTNVGDFKFVDCGTNLNFNTTFCDTGLIGKTNIKSKRLLRKSIVTDDTITEGKFLENAKWQQNSNPKIIASKVTFHLDDNLICKDLNVSDETNDETTSFTNNRIVEKMKNSFLGKYLQNDLYLDAECFLPEPNDGFDSFFLDDKHFNSKPNIKRLVLYCTRKSDESENCCLQSSSNHQLNASNSAENELQSPKSETETNSSRKCDCGSEISAKDNVTINKSWLLPLVLKAKTMKLNQ